MNYDMEIASEVFKNTVIMFGTICAANVASYVLDKLLALGKSLFNKRFDFK